MQINRQWQLMVAVLFCSLAIPAATITWTNPAGGNWSNTNNWSPNQVPGQADTALIINATASYTVTLDVAATVGGLVVGAANGTKFQTLDLNNQLLTLKGPATVARTGVLDIGNGGLAVAAPLTNNGTVNWQGAGAVQIYNDGTANNTGLIWNAGQWTITTSQTIYGDAVATDDIFYNRGTLTMNKANGTLNVGPFLDNSGGSVVAQAGAITFAGGSNLGGSFQAATGAGILFNYGTLNWNGTANFSGNVQIIGGTVNITGSVTSLAASFATLTGLSNIVSGAYLTNCTIADAERIVGTVYWTAGTLNNGASLTVASPGVLNLVTGNGNYFNINGPVTNNGTVNWTGGALAVNNDSNVSQSGGIWNLGTWNIKGNLNLGAAGVSGDQVFHNGGNLTANAAGDTIYFAPYLDNAGGSVVAQGGCFIFAGGSNLGGSFQASSGGTIAFIGGILNWNGSANFSGNVQITGGTVNVTASVTSLAATGVTITGLSNIVSGAYLTNCIIADAEQIAGSVHLAGQTINNGSSLTVAPTGILNLVPGGNGFGINGPLTNYGTVNWAGGAVTINNNGTSSSGVVWNAGVWNIQLPGELGANQGGGFTGNEFFQNSGSLVLTSSGTVAFEPKLINAGTVDVETGTLSLLSGATLGAAGTLEFGLNSLTSYGSISVTGGAALAGMLSAHLNGGYVPTAVGNTFPVLNYASNTGSFVITNLPSVAVWQQAYGAEALSLAVVKLVPQMTWATPANIVYGTALSGSQLNATFASPVAGGTNITGTYTYSPASGTILDSGSNQTLTVKFAPKDKTDFTNVTGSVTINVIKAPLTVTANSTSKTYGQTVTFAGIELVTSGLVNGDLVAGAALASPGAAPTAPVSGSPYSISITNAAGDAGLTNYNITYVNGTLAVTRAPLAVTANAQSKTYGQTVAFGSGSTLFTPAGLQNGETIGSVTLAVSGNGGVPTAPVAGSPYTITPSAATGGTFTAGNYTISYLTGLLTVNPADLTVTATGPTKTYGTALTVGPSTVNFTTSALQNGETVTSVTLTPGANGLSATVAAGTSYSVTPSAATGAGGFATGNYNITYKNYSGTVSPAPLTVTATAQSKTYGQTLTFGSGATQFTSNGLKNSDAISTVTITDTDSGGQPTAAAGGTYNLTPSAAVFSPGQSGNYTITYNPGLLTVNKATPMVTVVVGTYTYNGLAQGPNSITTSTTDTGAVTWSYAGANGTTYGPSASLPTAAGSYTATASVAADGNNHSATSSATAFTIGKAVLTVTATGPTKTYGTALAAGSSTANFTAQGLQNGEAVTSVTLTPGANGLSATAAAGVGYTVTPSAATGSLPFSTANYSITYKAYNGTVGQAPLTVTANARNKTYGTALTLGTSAFTPSGLQNGETIGAVTLTANGGTAANAAVSGSPYTITPSVATGGTFSAANYSIQYAGGQLTVNPLAVTLTGARVYDGTTTVAAGILAISDVVNGDQGNVTLSGSATLASGGVGTPAITSFSGLTLNGSAAGNYTLTGASGAVSITKATPTVTVTVGNYTYNGFSQGPNTAMISTPDNGAVTYSYVGVSGTSYPASALLPKAAGSYTVTASVVADANNNAAASSATAFAIDPAALTISANARTKTYGQTLVFGSGSTQFTTAGLQNGETVGSVTLTASGNSGTPTATVAGSPYTMTPSAATGGTFSAANYNITYATNYLTVGPASLTITADNTNKYVGDTVAFTGAEFTANGLQNGETIGAVTLTSDGAAAVAATGTYTITPSAPTGGTFSIGNYAPAYLNGTLTVWAPASLAINTVGDQYVLTFQSITGRNYQLQSAVDLAGGNWSDLGVSVTGNDEMVSVTNTLTEAPAFFRLMIAH